jgi:hypothetical protein
MEGEALWSRVPRRIGWAVSASRRSSVSLRVRAQFCRTIPDDVLLDFLISETRNEDFKVIVNPSFSGLISP